MIENKLDWENDFKNLFHESWHVYMQQAIESEWMWNIYNGKDGIRASRDRVLPDSAHTFKSFELCNFDEIKAVLVLSDPYPWIKNGKIVSDGIPMSCSLTSPHLQPSLEQFYDAMEAEYHSIGAREPDLSYLLKQGVFMINTALTVKFNKVGSHQEIWKPFMQYLFYDVLNEKKHLIYWLMGGEAKRVEKWIDPLANHILYSSHPASASHRETTWSSEGNFQIINTILKESKYETIWWDKKEWESVEQLPF